MAEEMTLRNSCPIMTSHARTDLRTTDPGTTIRRFSRQIKSHFYTGLTGLIRAFHVRTGLCDPRRDISLLVKSNFLYWLYSQLDMTSRRSPHPCSALRVVSIQPI
jgi:hypothetical protein